MDLFIEIGIIIIVTTLITGIIRFLKQPILVAYILSGIIVGPYFFNILQSVETIRTFSQIGIALLLFIVGLSLTPKVIKEVGKISLATGIGQIIFTSIFGFLIGILLGFSIIVSIYVAVALTFSSTIIIMKLLSDKGDSETLYGKIAIGFLIVQDLFVILILMIVAAIPAGTFNFATFTFGILLKGIGLLVLLFLLSIYVLPSVTKYIAKSQEFLLLFSIGWCLALASIFHYLNFSIEVGALLAGVTLAITPYRYEISSRMRPLRDFFIILFFILLGSQMVFSDISNHIIPIIIFSVFILIGNPLIVMLLMGFFGYTKRTSFLSGLTVAQISEFSLILIAVGVQVGHLTSEILSVVTAIGLITITGSTYMILYSNKIYPHLSKYLGIFERKGEKIDEKKYHKTTDYDVILFGCDRLGHDVLKSFKKIKEKFLVLDYNPEIVRDLVKGGVHCRYGDVGDVELLDELNLQKVKIIISTIPSFDINLLLINKIKKLNKEVIIIVVSHQINEAIKLYEEGATYVIMPYFLGGHYFSTLIEEGKLNPKDILKKKDAHIKYLESRKKNSEKNTNHKKHNNQEK
ncbi:MAG: cation:proton antiporter [Nanoarchaeota archaeon]|nr:cation:proton antiporter [Nanoarchaeota archaeon]